MKAYVITDLLAYMEKEYKAQGCLEHADALHQAISIIRGAGTEDDDPISEPARGQLFPLMKRAGLDLEAFKQHLLKKYGICSTKAIPWGLYDEICDWLVAQDHQRKFVHVPIGALTPLPSPPPADDVNDVTAPRHRRRRPRRRPPRQRLPANSQVF